MREGLITEADIERMKRGFEHYNAGDFHALRELFAPDVVIERIGDAPAIHGWDAFLAFAEPDAFEWQRIEALDWTIYGDKALIHVRFSAKGAASGLELNTDSWMVWTVRDGVVVHIVNRIEEAEARAAAGLGQNERRDRLRTD